MEELVYVKCWKERKKSVNSEFYIKRKYPSSIKMIPELDSGDDGTTL